MDRWLNGSIFGVRLYLVVNYTNFGKMRGSCMCPFFLLAAFAWIGVLYKIVHGLLAFATLNLNINTMQGYTFQHSTTRNRLVEKSPFQLHNTPSLELSTMTTRNNRGTQM